MPEPWLRLTQVIKSRDGTEETVTRSATWARSQYDAAADPILTVKGWVVIFLLCGLAYGFSEASGRIRLAVRAFLKTARSLVAFIRSRHLLLLLRLMICSLLLLPGVMTMRVLSR